MTREQSLSQISCPIFVVGHPRSGTTLLASMLGRHPDITSTPESLFLTQARYDIGSAFGGPVEPLVNRIMKTPLQHLVTSPSDLSAHLTEAKAAGTHLGQKEVFAIVLEAWRAAHDKARVLEKSPLHMRHIDEILSWFPDAKILWIIRDGRGNVASLKKVDWAKQKAVTLARQWVRNTELALDSEKRAKTAVLRIHYEDLLSEPDKTMRAINEHLSVAPSDTVFDHSQAATTIKVNEMGWKEKVNKPLEKNRSLAWQEELSERELMEITPIMAPLLQRLGYPVENYTQNTRDRIIYGIKYSRAGLQSMRLVFAT